MHFFGLESAASLSEVPLEGKIHLIGVCGIAMGQLAIALAEAGYTVSGSDREFYPPMSRMLENSTVKLHRGYAPSAVPEECDLVIIGNNVPVTNEEVRAVQEKSLPHSFLPKVLQEFLIQDRCSIVVAGTHGKTTTTAMLAHLFTSAGRSPSFFVGGDVPGFERSFVRGEGPEVILEGDEYDSVFYVKRPKFIFYKPQILVLNALEFDHADIYPTMEDLRAVFRELLTLLPSSGVIVASHDSEELMKLLWESELPCRLITFGESEDADYRITDVSTEDELQVLQINHEAQLFELRIPQFGLMNGRNALAAWITSSLRGISHAAASEALAGFRGVRRRLEKRRADPPRLLFEDFAHHPSAVRETVQALRSRFQNRTIWVAFEPRSNTSRRGFIQDEYAASFQGADRVFFKSVSQRAGDRDGEILDVDRIVSELRRAGIQAECGETGKAIGEKIISDAPRDILICVMSNGSFDGLIEQLESAFYNIS